MDRENFLEPILRLENRTDEDREVAFLGTTLSPTRSDIGLVINDQAYKLQRPSGESESVTVLLRAQSKYDVYLTVESVVGIQFSEDFEIKITVE